MNPHAATSVPPTAGREEPLAVFDLDGTLVRGDSFLPFLLSYAWRYRRFRPLLTASLTAARESGLQFMGLIF